MTLSKEAQRLRDYRRDHDLALKEAQAPAGAKYSISRSCEGKWLVSYWEIIDYSSSSPQSYPSRPYLISVSRFWTRFKQSFSTRDKAEVWLKKYIEEKDYEKLFFNEKGKIVNV